MSIQTSSKDNHHGEAFVNCSKEPIHVPGAIQSFGVLLALSEPDFLIERCSQNVAEVFGIEAAQALGRPIGFLIPNIEVVLNSHLSASDFFMEEPVRISTGDGDLKRMWDLFLHRKDSQLILELEHRSQNFVVDLSALNSGLRKTISEIEASKSLLELSQQACEGVKRLTGLDRVMVYKFNTDGHGEVIAESKNENLPRFLNHHYPASDIPAQARALFLVKWIRMIPDRDYQPVPLVSNLSKGIQSPLDLTCSLLRSSSPIHIQYLKNMGVRASLTISLIQEGKLWGLIAGHHYQGPKQITFEIRAACETIGKLMSTQLIPKADFEIRDHRKRFKEVHDKLIEQMEEEPDLIDEPLKHSPNLFEVLESSGGAATMSGGGWVTFGKTPSVEEIEHLTDWLETKKLPRGMFHTNNLALEYPAARCFSKIGAGLLALKIPKGSRNYILWFKPEVVQTVAWAGEPEKSIVYESGEPYLHPRTSFEEWRETVKQKSLPWAEWELEAVLELRNSIVALDLPRQFEKEKQLRAEAERANKQKEELLAIVSHDLKNPLSSLKLSISLIQKTLSPEALSVIENTVSWMLRSLDGMNHLIDDLLAIAKIESGKVTFEKGPYSTDDLLKETFELLRPIAEQKGVQLEVKMIAPRSCVAFCDRARILQVFSNLVGNAIKFTPERGLVRLDVEECGTSVKFSVLDSGIGIPKEHLGLIFDRFWQARQNRMGTGLGLSIAKAIVETHGGKIWAESEPGKGCTFHFTVPAYNPAFSTGSLHAA